ncbi:MAG: hypothetical protein HYW63_01600 [Candidatus Levybacteria bacterium]|nr:hypothetical protein [Candidatus Levybacteria bacterium]
MRRYKFLEKEAIYEALNRLRDSFLAATDGNEVEEIINGLLTLDERLKIGRRILIAEYISSGVGIDEISRELKVGKNTIVHVMRLMDARPDCYNLIRRRGLLVEKEYRNKRYSKTGGSQLVFKRNEYTGFNRKDVKRK